MPCDVAAAAAVFELADAEHPGRADGEQAGVGAVFEDGEKTTTPQWRRRFLEAGLQRSCREFRQIGMAIRCGRVG